MMIYARLKKKELLITHSPIKTLSLRVIERTNYLNIFCYGKLQRLRLGEHT